MDIQIILSIVGIGASGFFSWFFSKLYFEKGVSRETDKLRKNTEELFSKLAKVMCNTGISHSVILNKTTFTKEEVQEIVDNKVNEIIDRRNIQLDQFAKDILSEELE